MNRSRQVPRELQSKVRRKLESSERILWMAQPIPRFFTQKSISAVVFAIPWTAFAVFWICGAAGFKFPDFSKGDFSLLPLFGLPFLLVGIAMLLSPVWAYRKALNTVYVITDRRAVAVEAGWITAVRSYPPDKMRTMHLQERRDGTGDLVFFYRDEGFQNIREPKTVEQMAMKLAESISAGESR